MTMVRKELKKKPSKWKRIVSGVKTVGQVASTAATALRVARSVAALINVEKKYFDTSQSASITDTGALYPLSNMAQGTTYNTRDGNSIKATSIVFRIRGFMSTTPTVTNLRFIVFIDLEYNSTGTIQVTDVLENANYLNPVNHTNGKRFKILYDKTYSLSNAGPIGFHKRLYLKLNHHMKYADNSTTNLREGSMYVLAIGDQSVNYPGLAYYSRLRFIDN